MESIVNINMIAVLEASSKDVLIKCFNLSRKSRECVKTAIKAKRIILKKYNEKAKILGGLLCLGKLAKTVWTPKILIKEITDYSIRDQADLDLIKEAATNLNCSLELNSQVNPTNFEIVKKMKVSPVNVKFCENLSFKTISFLTLAKLSLVQIQSILKSIQNIEKICLISCKIDSETAFSATNISFSNCKFDSKVGLPSVLSLTIEDCTDIHNLACSTATELTLDSVKDLGETYDWLASLKSLKKIRLNNCNLSKCFEFLHCSLRIFSDLDNKKYKIDLSDFPLIRSLDSGRIVLPSDKLNNTSLREIKCGLKPNGGFKAEIRIIHVLESNFKVFNKYSEPFENCTHLVICTDRFKFDKASIYQIETISFEISKPSQEFLSNLKENAHKLTEANICLETLTNLKLVTEILSAIKLSKSIKVPSRIASSVQNGFPSLNIIPV